MFAAAVSVIVVRLYAMDAGACIEPCSQSVLFTEVFAGVSVSSCAEAAAPVTLPVNVTIVELSCEPMAVPGTLCLKVMG